MAPRGAPQKSIFGTQTTFAISGLCAGSAGAQCLSKNEVQKTRRGPEIHGSYGSGYLRKSLLRPQIARNHRNKQISRKPSVTPKPCEIPTELILSAIQNPTEFH